jgi:Ca-activated chloride channel family protein|tara:strand:- start:14331 stop:15761 length:1431 start_codon:yes stop_codon:yes gene_type:complete
MKNILLFLFITSFSFLFGQTEFSTRSHDFGELEEYSDRFVDIKITNKGIKKEYILSVKKPADVVYIVNGQFMDKDSSLIVRLQVNPKEKGRFNYSIDIFTSDKNEATKIVLKGNLLNPPRENLSAFQSCPTFGQRSSSNPLDFELTVVTIDKETKEPLSKSLVTLLQNGRAIGAYKTNRSGKIVEKTPLGYTYFYGKHEGYYPVEYGTYVNFKRNYIVLELEKDKTIPVEIPDIPIEIAELPKEEPVEVEEPKKPSKEIVIEIEKELEQEVVLPKEAPVELAKLDPNDFSNENFKPVNVVFVLDISSSMNQGDKIELMKFALYEMVDMMRPQDKISLVTYSTQARVLLDAAKGNEKTEANEKVEELKASGMTAGGEGIKLGYKQNLKSYLDGGVNQVIVITDGAFNRNSDDYMKYVRKYQKKGVNLSIVGVKNSENDAVKMTEAAEKGGGHYIPIQKLADAKNNLKQEIRILSYKY